MFDCIIVGAGPAGATAAYHLAKAGRSVLVLEKASLPRYKSCGGGVSPAVAQLFDFDLTPVIDNTVDSVMFTWKMGDAVTTKLDSEPMWMVQRDKFDNFLVEQAKAKGAEFKDNTQVNSIANQGDSWQVSTTGDSFSARYLIAADGALGPMANWLGFEPKKQFCAVSLEVETTVAAAQQHQAHFEFGTLKNGSIWNFPKANGYSISAAVMGNTKGKVQDLKNALTKYAEKSNIDLSKSQFFEHPLCLWSEKQPLHKDNALLVGEAAGIVDPLLAEGIRPAISTGYQAAIAIDKALAGETDALANYTQAVTQEWVNEMALAQRLAGPFYKFTKIIYKVAVKRPYASQIMSQILCGQRRYSDVTDKVMKKFKFIPGVG